MFLRLAAATAFVISLSAGAIAQTASDGDQDSGKTSIPAAWTGPIAEAFYTDGSGAALRSEAEAKSNFAALTPELQAQVKTDCLAMVTPMNPAASTDTTTTSSTDTGDAGAGAAGATAAQAATASQVCMWVGQN